MAKGTLCSAPAPLIGEEEPAGLLLLDEVLLTPLMRRATLAIILKRMEGMQQIQKKLLAGGSKGGDEESVEVVKAGTVELPRSSMRKPAPLTCRTG